MRLRDILAGFAVNQDTVVTLPVLVIILVPPVIVVVLVDSIGIIPVCLIVAGVDKRTRTLATWDVVLESGRVCPIESARILDVEATAICKAVDGFLP